MKLLSTSANSRKLYAALGVSDKATTAQIRAQFLNISKTYHPDIMGYSHPVFELAMQAYIVLMDPISRRIYDLTVDGDEKLDLKARALGIIRVFTGILIEEGKVNEDIKLFITKYINQEAHMLIEAQTKTKLAVNNANVLIASVQNKLSKSEPVKEAMIHMANESIAKYTLELIEFEMRLKVLETASVLMEATEYDYQPPPPPVIVRDYRTMKGVNLADLINDSIKSIQNLGYDWSPPPKFNPFSDILEPYDWNTITPIYTEDEDANKNDK